jgi:hypothetical protein
METVKVDMQRLQLLNERIAQTLDALNQVRQSAHGIQHTPTGVAPWQYGVYGAAAVPPYATTQTPYATGPFATSPYAAPFFAGIQHTASAFVPGAALNPYAAPFAAVGPYGVVPAPAAFSSPLSWGIQHSVPPTASAFGTPYAGNGISHTSWDPSWQARQTQMWPTTQWQYPVSIA